ncbi:MAG: GntR family transcriptional regulator [Alcaligenaceae bacterium]|jgi:DNA-binding GntR family transcriptional regulator|nr:GntR family transcriptional regulator [Alcaligenaceae bacterium]
MQQKSVPLKKSLPRESGNKRIPRYAWLHQTLLTDIESGKYPVGSHLPTEEQLSTIYGVSRHTVREATRRLAEKGMITRSPSTGTVVNSATPIQNQSVYVSTFGSMDDLMLYTAQTRIEPFAHETILADQDIAQQLLVPLNEKLVRLHAYRKLVKNDLLISYSHIYLNPAFKNIKNHLKGNHPSVFELLKTEFNQEIEKVHQEVGACLMPHQGIQALQLKPDCLALRITRVYFDKSNRLLAASDNFYIENNFRLITTWQKDNEQTKSLIK